MMPAGRIHCKYFLGPEGSIDCEISEWTEWRNSDPDYPDDYDYKNGPDYDYKKVLRKRSSDYNEYESGDDYEDPPTTSDCTCIRIRFEGNETINELQYRRRTVLKEGTIGGRFCGEKTFEVQQCVCDPGEFCFNASNQSNIQYFILQYCCFHHYIFDWFIQISLWTVNGVNMASGQNATVAHVNELENGQ